MFEKNVNLPSARNNQLSTGYSTTVKPVYNDHLGDKVSVVVIDKWLL